MLQNFSKIVLFVCVTILISANPTAYAAATTKTVLITGGATGLGKEIAQAFKNDGWSVWVTTRDPSKHANLKGVTIRRIDITNQQQVHDLINEIKTINGRLDAVVNNAGYGVIGPQEAISVAQAQEQFNVNVIGPLVVTQQALPLMRANRSGHIINISSTSGLRALPGLGLYSASKMALEGMSESLAAELLPWGIKVSIIEPGTVKNDWAQNAQLAANLEQYPGYKPFTNRLRNNLIQKSQEIGQNPAEIANLAIIIANNPNPDLRYQTNSQAAAVANEVLAEPTGNLMRDKMCLMAKDLYDLPG
jgi:NAD(P)-dependent dehydrogenase (short-subunit alcohol dehydrogenase family)